MIKLYALALVVEQMDREELISLASFCYFSFSEDGSVTQRHIIYNCCEDTVSPQSLSSEDKDRPGSRPVPTNLHVRTDSNSKWTNYLNLDPIVSDRDCIYAPGISTVISTWINSLKQSLVEVIW